MRRNSSKLDRIPQPLTLSRKLNFRGFQDTNPYRIGEQLKENKPSTERRHSGLAEMKQQLMQIKDDMVKLFATSSEDPVSIANPPDILHQALKQQLAQQKLSEEKLKRQIEKNKADYLKAVQVIKHEKDTKIEQLKRDKESSKGKYEKIIGEKNAEINRLRQEGSKSESYFQSMMAVEKSKYDALKSQFSALENTIRQLNFGNLRHQQTLLEGLQVKKLNIELSTKLESMALQLQSYKSLAATLQDQIKQLSARYVEAIDSISCLENNQMSLLQRLQQAQQQGQSNQQFNNQQLNAQRLQMINLELSMNDLQEQNYVLTEHNKFIKGILVQTEEYIKALEGELQNYIRTSKREYRKGTNQV